MNILLISPTVFPIKPDSGYVGIERLTWEYAKELIKEHNISVIGHPDSIYPQNVVHLPAQDEYKGHLEYSGKYHNFDVIQDFSHLHLASRFIPNLPSMNIFWHAPAEVKYPKAPYNIIGLSQWACREFRRIYHQEAKYMQGIVIDPDVFHPDGERGDRFLTMGRMGPEKGNLNAIKLCQELGLPLDVVGGRGAELSDREPLTSYEQEILKNCDGEQIKFWGELAQERIPLFQHCKALIYYTERPEVTAHKVFEAMLCGAPVIVPAIGSFPEWITEGIDGYLCGSHSDFVYAVQNIDKLQPKLTLEANIKKFSTQSVVKEWLSLYEEVKNGLRW